MKRLLPYFSRVTALLLLVMFSFTSCFSPLYLLEHEIVVITPGEGNPKYVYIDSEGSPSETDTGRTALFIENNKNAEGALVVADKYDEYDRVMVYNPDNGSVVSMFFKQGRNFPYQITISHGDNPAYLAFLSQYRETSGSYDIVFQEQGNFYTLSNLILNKNIFNLYEDDNNLNSSQNLRLRNITIALGLWGSLAASLEDKDKDAPVISLGLGPFWKGVKSFFTATKIVAAVVAVVATPIVTLINPAAGEIVYNAAVIAVSDIVIKGITQMESSFGKEPLSGPSESLVNVLKYYDNAPFTNGEEFHIGRGSNVVLNFTIPYFDNKNISLNNWTYDTDEKQEVSNLLLFEMNMEKNDNPDEFQMKFSRIITRGFIGNGNVAFGLQFAGDIEVNGSKEPVLFKLLDETEAVMHNDMVVVRFCIYPNCPDYVD